MKVTTDGCLFGAIIANVIKEEGGCQVLDIGAGTGLLSLMVAQENTVAVCDAVEIDLAAAVQAKENIDASPWSERIQVVNADILQYQPVFQYDVIISNPPFHEQQLSSPVASRRLAHHSSELPLRQLFQRVSRLLKEEGKFFVLLPFYRTEEAIDLAKAIGLFAEKEWRIKQTSNHSFFRTIYCFSKQQTGIQSQSEITIRDEKGSYSNTFIKLLQPFYLHL